jgi:glutamate synthase (NADPH) small chain
MLKFVDTPRATPPKREAGERRADFGEIYREYAAEKAAEQAGAARNAACPIARRIARCTTTSPTG